MRVVYTYGLLAGGGCERRTGQLMRWLLDRGDDAWLLGTGWAEAGQAMMLEQCKVPADRIVIMPAEQLSSGSYEDFLSENIERLEADVIDVQWTSCLPSRWTRPSVFTMHGISQPVPAHAPFSKMICIENLPSGHPGYHQESQTKIEVIWNWVDLDQFPFQRDLGEGACYVGRSFKAANALKVCTVDPDVTIDGYGTDFDLAARDFPANFRWLGYAKPEEFIYRYRVVFGCAIAAVEGLAAGRLVIAGGWQGYAGRQTYGHLVRPHLLERMSGDQFTGQSQADAVEPTAEEVYRDFQLAMEDDMTEQRLMMRAWVEQYHHPDRQMEKVRRVYEEAIARE
ncbi:MAG TPA: hypothetical protein VM537_17405 [Anaerolineae bacterium]|nr:hypothetical protein [Anaerolineae bacterium]